jgi:hypothetical protein
MTDDDWFSVNVTGAHSYILEDLTPNTDYQVHVRSICSEGGSIWSATIDFTTLDTPPPPPCESPVNLSVTEITTTSATLSWEEGNEENLNWELRFKEASDSEWNNVDVLEETTYLLEELTPNTAYLWAVRALCSEERTSEWSDQIEFTTEPLAINDLKKDRMTVFASGKIINILNPENRFIEKIQLFGIQGNLLGEYVVNSTDNVLIPTTLLDIFVLVKIVGKNETETHKCFIKF